MFNKEEFVRQIKIFKSEFNFSLINLDGAKTQDRANITEKYVKHFLLKLIKNEDDYLIIKAGSQQPIDYILIKKDNIEKWPIDFKNDFIKKNEKDGKVHNILKKYFKEMPKWMKDQILRIEVKAGKGDYYGNDTLPDPVDPVIYFFFDWKLNEIFISSSVEMAKSVGEKEKQYILRKYMEDKNEIEKWRKDKIEQWKGIGISSVPRMTYKFNGLYAYTKQDIEGYNKLFEIFNKAIK